MPNIFIPGIRRNIGAQQPRWPWRLNEGSDQAEGLALWVPSRGENGLITDLINFDPATLENPGNIAQQAHANGGWATFVDASGDVVFKTPTADLNNYPLMMAALYVPGPDAGFQRIGHITDVASAFRQLFIFYNGTTNVLGAFHHVYSGGADSATATGSIIVNPGEVVHCAGKFLSRLAGDISVYSNGIFDGNADQDATASINANDEVGFGRLTDSTPADTTDFQMIDFRLYDKDVPDDVIFKMYDVPTRYELYEEFGQRTYYDMGGARDDVKIAVASAATITATGNQIFTAALDGKTPKAALFISSRATAEGTPAASYSFGVGACDAVAEWALATTALDAVGTTQTGKIGRSTACILLAAHTNSPTITGEASFVSFQANEVTINWSNAPDEADRITVILFAGDDLEVDVNSFKAANLVDTSVDVATGFEPDLVLFASGGFEFSGTKDHSVFSFGVAHNSTSIIQRCLAMHDEHAIGTTALSNVLLNNRCIAQQSFGTIDWSGELTAFNPGPSPAAGFTQTTRVAAAGTLEDIGYLALKIGGLRAWIGSIDTPTATGDDVNANPGFTPQAVLLGMSMLSVENTVQIDGNAGALGISAFTEDAESSIAIASEDAVVTSNVQQLQSDVAVDLKPDDGSTTNDFIATGPKGTGSFDTLGFTLDYSAVDAGTVRKWFGIAIEQSQPDPAPAIFLQPMLVVAN